MQAHTDEKFMRECLRLAEKGRGQVNPNPMVGAVVVRNGRIVARGFHRAIGKSHAEVEALKVAGRRAKGATLYVNLEPCCHRGKTPPCTESIIKAEIKEVICATLDPNALVRGRGATLLREAGIRVSVGILKEEAKSLNEAFFTFHEKKRPFVALKFATSLDGKLATHRGESKWITNNKARAYARTLRGDYQAILTGISTIIKDDPHLGARAKGKRDPLRIILDSKLRIPLKSKVLRDKNVLIVATTKSPAEKRRLLEKRGVSIHIFPGTRVPLRKLLSLLRKKEVVSVLVEGGGETLGSFVDMKLVDKMYAFYAPILIGGERSVSIRGKGVIAISDSLRLNNISIRRFGSDFLVVGTP